MTGGWAQKKISFCLLLFKSISRCDTIGKRSIFSVEPKGGPQQHQEGHLSDEQSTEEGNTAIWRPSWTLRVLLLPFFLTHWRGRKDSQTWCPLQTEYFTDRWSDCPIFQDYFSDGTNVHCIFHWFSIIVVNIILKELLRGDKTAFITSWVLHNRAALAVQGAERNGRRTKTGRAEGNSQPCVSLLMSPRIFSTWPNDSVWKLAFMHIAWAHFVRFVSAHAEGRRPINLGRGEAPLIESPGSRWAIIIYLPPVSSSGETHSWGGRFNEEKMSGQTLTDRIAAAQYQLTGSDMARAVCKATTHEVMAPKKKHLECKSFFLYPILHGPT